jgi:hypothetical protein
MHACMHADVMMDTEELVDNPVSGPVVRALWERLGFETDPREGLLPVTRLPLPGLLGRLPALVPIPNLQASGALTLGPGP